MTLYYVNNITVSGDKSTHLLVCLFVCFCTIHKHKKWESWASKFLAGPVTLESYWSCWPVQNTILILTLFLTLIKYCNVLSKLNQWYESVNDNLFTYLQNYDELTFDVISTSGVPRKKLMKYFSNYGRVLKLSGETSNKTPGVLRYRTAQQAKRAYADGIQTNEGRCYQFGTRQVYLKPCWSTQNVSIFCGVGEHEFYCHVPFYCMYYNITDNNWV